ncbi:MAG TPA: hypothetical protein GX714_02645 [Chloroflexi bacterium]|nr:hypothetical protein [Chloroflexota bacterium]
MEIDRLQPDCQIPCVQRIAEGDADLPPQSLATRPKLVLHRVVGPSRERTLKQRTNDLMNWVGRHTGRGTKPAVTSHGRPQRLQAGDVVRVRSEEEIAATLNHWRQLRGCTFMPEMRAYCGTRQRVYRVMERFVDERDLRSKRTRGIVLLEGVMCQGTAVFGRCDRSCFLFWREEWLEKVA